MRLSKDVEIKNEYLEVWNPWSYILIQGGEIYDTFGLGGENFRDEKFGEWKLEADENWRD